MAPPRSRRAIEKKGEPAAAVEDRGVDDAPRQVPSRGEEDGAGHGGNAGRPQRPQEKSATDESHEVVEEVENPEVRTPVCQEVERPTHRI